jgi:hypothetical protein
MAGLVVALLVAWLLAWLLLRRALPRTNSLMVAVPIYLAAVVLAAFFFFIAMLAFSQSAALEATATLEPLDTLDEVMAQRGEDQILVTGRISSRMDRALADYVAYVEVEEDGYSWLPALEIDLADRQSLDVSDGYAQANWLVEGDYLVLKAGDPVVVLGEPDATSSSLATGQGVSGVGLQAQLVYRGSYDSYVSDYLPGQNWPVTLGVFLAAVGLFSAALMFIIPLPKLYGLWRRQVVKVRS